jgi:hypothetical protein
MVSFHAGVAHGFSISAVTISPSNVVPPAAEVSMTIDIETPTQPTWLYADTRVSTNAAGVIGVEVYPASGALDAIGSLREKVTLGVFPPGTHHYQVTIHPDLEVSWGTRTNRGSFTVTDADPVVYISATRPETLEPSLTTRVSPGEFTITRIGNTNEALTLFVEFAGTATFGEDYEQVQQTMVMPAGERKLTFHIAPLDDSLVEGDESVIATLSPSPPINSLPNYSVHWRLNHAAVVIHDNDFAGDRPVVSISTFSNTLEFCPPNAGCAGIIFNLRRTGPGLNQPLTVFLRYTGTATAGSDYHALPSEVTFEAGNEFASATSTPIDDTLHEGDETIIADIIEGLNYHADPNRWRATTVILDNEAPAPPIISLELIEGDAAETLPTQNAIFTATFRVRRTGPATNELTVFLNTQQGTARLGVDYRLDGVTDGEMVRFPAGASAVTVQLYPIDDNLYEGDETVFFHLIAPPSGTPPSGQYTIEFAHSSVSMVIHDNDPVETRLEITSPLDGQHFAAGDVIPLRAQIVGPGSSNSWSVDFFDGNQRIGTTQAGGTIWWANAIGGQHVIGARAYSAAGVALEAPPVTISVGPGPALPVVSIFASGFRTAEPCPVCLVAPGVFTIARTGPTNEALNVYLEYDGPATPGVDYNALPHQITIPAGTNSARVLLLAIDDHLVEGPEIARATLVAPELANGGYVVSQYASEAMVVIGDDESGAPEIRLDIVEPKEGAQFAAGTTIEISALGVWTQGEVDRPVQFFAGNQLIGQSNPPLLGRPTIPGLPSVHTIFWTNPPPGQHALTARFALTSSSVVTSPPVNISVGGELRTIVRIEATQNIAEESSYPYRRLPLRGEFTISRTGPTSNALPVFVHYSGSATPGDDYPAEPFLAVIPEGAASVRIEIVPVDDGIREGIETVVAAISHCPPETDPPLGVPCYLGFEIDPARERATVVIRDNGITEASLAITRPEDGANFLLSEAILIEAVAIDLNGYISRVEFWDGATQIGVSEITFIRAPDPGTPIHHSFEWRRASPDAHVLTARAIQADGTVLSSPPVHITVGDGINRPIITMTAPDCFAIEPSSNATPDTATFRIRRHGPTNDALVVAYSLHGTALNGTDYETLPSLATIAVGSQSVDVVIRPLADKLAEGRETVVLRLEPGPQAGPIAAYHIGRPGVAAAVISDEPWAASSGAANCILLSDGLKHICFSAGVGYTFRIEASSDLSHWETVCEDASSDGIYHFIDPETGIQRRFYRLMRVE